MRSLLISLSIFVLLVSCEGEKSDHQGHPAREVKIPNVCQTVAVIGLFPNSGNLEDETYAYACFEGYEMRENSQKVWLSDSKCREGAAIAETGSEEGKLFKPVEGSTCPTEGIIAACETDTSNVLIYEDAKGMFQREKFEDFCKQKSGRLKSY